MKKRYFTLFLLLLQAVLSAQIKTYTHFYSHDHVTSIAARGNYVWIGYDCGLERRNISTGQTDEFFTYNSGLTRSNFIRALAIDSSGSLFISAGQFDPVTTYGGLFPGGLIKFDGENWTDISRHFYIGYYYSASVTYMAPDRKNNIWLVASHGLYRYSIVEDSAYFMLPAYPQDTLPIAGIIVAAAFDTSGIGYFATKESGLLKYDGKSWIKIKGLPDSLLSAAALDKNGNLWVGFSSKGLAKLNGSGWTYYNKSNSGLPDDSVTSITVDSAGNIWAGTHHGGAARLSGTKWKVFNTSSGLPDSTITCLATDSKGNVWAGTLSGSLSFFDGTKWNNTNTSNSGLNSNRIKRVAVDSSDALWIVTDEQALFSFDGNKWTRYSKDNSPLPGNYVYEAAVDPKGNKWFLVSSMPFNFIPWTHPSISTSAVMYDGTSWKIFDSANTNPLIKVIYAVAFDSLGNTWLSIENGLAKYDGTTWSVYLAKDMVPPLGIWPVYCMAVKASGNIYLGTTSDMFRFDGKKWFWFYRGYKGWGGFNEMIIDRKGMLWAAMGQQSGSRIRGNLIKFNWYKETWYSDSGVWNWFWSAAVEKTNTVWGGSFWEGLYRIDGENDTMRTIFNMTNSSLPDDDIRSIAIDRNNLKWIGTGSAGIMLFADNKMLLSGLTAENRIPEEFSLSQNYPNPFNPATTISYSIAHGSLVTLKLYDILGREVALIEKANKTAGTYKVKFDASGLPSGIYFYRLEAGGFSDTKKCILLK